jgi:hypothetical protein
MVTVTRPFALLVSLLSLLSITVHSYTGALGNVRRVFQPVRMHSLHRNMNYPSSSFSLNSMSNTQSERRERVPLPALITQYIERMKSMTSRNMINTIQKCSVICTLFLSTFLPTLLLNSRRAAAAAAPLLTVVTPVLKSVKGWDLFGRVPHDDWLFTTRALTDKSLLKRSFLESVSGDY